MASRLIDKLLVDPNLSDIHENLIKSVIIQSDNVSEYFSQQLKNGATLGSLCETLPSVAPPFKDMFIQFRYENIDWGLLISSHRNDENNNGIWEGWQVATLSFWDHPTSQKLLGVSTFFTDLSGILSYADNERSGIPIKCEIDDYWQFNPQQYREVTLISTIVALWTLAFMNCKNATLEPVEPNAAENKRRAKHGKLPLMRYHVLKIKPFGNRSDAEAQGGTHGSPALHIRRGHFKTYTDAAPLFGQFVGTYWWEQSIAGKKSNRVVVKDYEMDLTGAKN